MNINEIKHNAKERFAKYTANYDLSQPKIALKAKHTYKVAELCETIARSENLSEEDVLIAWLCGLLHDIGRFEQVTRFNTFLDGQSVDHAHLSCEILYGSKKLSAQDRCPGADEMEPIVRDFYPDSSWDDLIFTAIWWHSAYRYPEMDERHKLFCDIIRDADKIDIFRVNLETPLSDIHNVPLEEFYTSAVTPEVFEAFKEHHCVLRSLKKTAIDNLVGYLSLFWELQFPESRNIARTQGYMNQMAHFESKNTETLEIFSQIRKELRLE